MKKLIQTMLFFSIGFIPARSQNQTGINPPETNPEIVKIKGFFRNDSYLRPFTDQEIQKFCDYIEANSIVKELKINDKVPFHKIRVAVYFYQNNKIENQKKKILNLMMNMFTDIQDARDALGVDPLFDEESWLYIDTTPPIKNENEYKNLEERMIADQLRSNEIMSKQSKLSKKISDLSHIHAYLHRAITHQMKVPLEGISPKLERSPAEKARTKDMLEKQAAAAGRKKPEPKAPVTDRK